MIKHTVIEDASPYFVRFTHPGIEKIIDLCNKVDIEREPVVNASLAYNRNPNFYTVQIPDDIVGELLSNIPMSKTLHFQCAMLFVSKPGADFPIHKDGSSCTFGFNYTVKILDDKCETHFYNDSILENLDMVKEVNKHGNVVRIVPTDSSNHPAAEKTMVAKEGECLLFNAGMFHDWDNTASDNVRVILVLRSLEGDKLSFDDAKKLFLGIQ